MMDLLYPLRAFTAFGYLLINFKLKFIVFEYLFIVLQNTPKTMQSEVSVK